MVFTLKEKKEMPIRILQVGMTSDIGGVDTYLIQQFNKLDKKKIIYDFIRYGKRPLAKQEELKKDGARIFEIQPRRQKTLLYYFQWILFFIRHYREYRGIVVNTLEMTTAFPIILAYILGVPNRIVHSHNSGTEKRMNRFRRVFIKINFILNSLCSTEFWACSQKAGEWMFGSRPFKVIHNAVEADKFAFDKIIREKTRSELKLDTKIVIGNVARFSYQKNHVFLIKVFNEICKKKKNAVLMLVGAAYGDMTYYNQTISLINKYGLSEKVMFLGVRDDVHKLYQAMDCFVIPSHFEGLSVAAVEAQAAGVPIVSSDALSKETVLVPNMFKMLSLKDDVNLWADTIIKSSELKHQDTRKSIKEMGYDADYEVNKIFGYFNI